MVVEIMNSQIHNSRFAISYMRLDLFLKASRICPRRTVAQKLCDAGLVSLNGNPAKPAHPVKTGDEIEIRRQRQVSTLRVLSVPSERQPSKKDSGSLFEILSEYQLNDRES
jgi:ribosomal 50S subunit-recycling heat shock protein